MSPPVEKKELQSFLGTIQYLVQLTKSDRIFANPVEKKVLWQWRPEPQEALNSLKQAITSAAVLGDFDPGVQLEVQADTSKDGLGVCMFQEVTTWLHFKSTERGQVKLCTNQKGTSSNSFCHD